MNFKSLKIGIISQARMTSTRLPGKVLKTVNGVTMLEYQIRRLKTAQVPYIVATTTNREDDPVVALCKDLDVPTYRGSEFDVLERYYLAAQENDLDIVIRVTSDCPLIDGHLVKEGIEQYLSRDNENLYLSNTLERTFPRGMDFEIFRFKMLQMAYENAIDPAEREHVTPYIWRNQKGLFHVESFLNDQDFSKYRITVDEDDDFKLLQELIGNYGAGTRSCQEIIQIMEAYPQLAEINRLVEQKKVELKS